MDHIDSFFKHNSKYVRLQKPLEAAHICETARTLADGHYDVVSYNKGLLTLAVASVAEATNLRMTTLNIQKELNEKLGSEIVKKIRIKIN